MKIKHGRAVLPLLMILVIFTSIIIPSFLFSATALGSVSKDEALEILMRDIIKPSNTTYRLGAYMLSQSLQSGDVISSDSGAEYSIADSTWFIFIDDNPCAAYEHDVRYTFINASTGNWAITDETWPPYINGMSMRNASLNRGELVEMFSVLNEPWFMPVVNYTASNPPLGDYGDAPDGQKAYYVLNGSFPTLFNTTHSKFGRPGAHTLNVGQEMLGASASAEVDANDPSDPDGMQNLVDADSDERMFLIVENATAKLAFDVTANASAPNVTRYINVLLDFDQSGNWAGNTNGKEWPIINTLVDVPNGTTKTIITPNFTWGGINKTSPVWMRVALTREEINATLFEPEGWDGSGEFEYGEIEDSLVFLMDDPPPGNLSKWWPPKSGTPPADPGGQSGGGDPPQDDPEPPHDPLKKGPDKGPCGCPIHYYALIISGGDNEGEIMMKASADRMHKVLEAQNYEILAYLGSGQSDKETGLNTKTNIKAKIDELRGKLLCGDRVFVYICGHGRKAGGIALKRNGVTRETLTPKELSDWLDTIKPCEQEYCCAKERCCYVTIVIESCFSDNFGVLRKKGRIIATSSTDQPAWGYNTPDGADYTRGFENDLRDPAADISGDGIVDAKEAHDSANELVKKFNEKYKQQPPQTPTFDDQSCECKCPPDFGDAPDPPYPSLLASIGARHVDWKHEWLGIGVNGEPDSKQVDIDEFDDGVTFGGNIVPGGNLILTITISTSGEAGRYDINNASKEMYLNAWVDWNRDGVWATPAEKIIGTFSSTGTQSFATPMIVIYNVQIPAWVSGCHTWLRFRVDYAEDVGIHPQPLTDPSLDQEEGQAMCGEVEDYTIKIEAPPCVGGKSSQVEFDASKLSELRNWVTPLLTLSTALVAVSVLRVCRNKKQGKKRLQ